MKRTSLALLVVFTSCARLLPHEQSVVHPGGYQRTITDRSAAKSQITEGPIANVPSVLDVLFRVRPDRRFVNAVADIRELSGGRKINDVQIEFVNGGWDVSLGDEKTVRFRELPTFRDAVTTLSGWARAQRFDSATLSHYDRALGYFLTSAEGQWGYPPTSMSLSRLWAWRAAKLPWSEIKRQGIL